MEKKKLILSFRDKPIGEINSFIVDQDDNLIASLLKEVDMYGYTIVFHFDKTVEPFYASSPFMGMSETKKLMRERGYEVNRL
ncbi:MAG: hypothetical protein IT215_02540 [Chitinophagaceae bacterium]|nr:hypothetical protein [Chitinophagaceae bacterium]